MVTYDDTRRTPGGYPQKTAPQYNPGMYRTGKKLTVPTVKKSGTYKGYPLPVDNRDSSPFVGVPKDSAFYDKSQSPYVTEYMQNGKIGTEEDGTPIPVADNTWQELDAWKNRKSEAEITALQKDLVKAGWLTKQSITGTFSEATEKAMQALMLVGNKSGRSWRSLVVDAQTAVRNGEQGGPIGTDGSGSEVPQDYTQVSTSYNKMPKRDALTAVKDAMTEDLGRAPTEQELQGFIRDLRQFERANPNVTTTEHKYEQQGDMWVDNPVSTTEPGADPAGLLDTYAEEKNPKAVKRYKKANILASVIDDIANGVL